jgi:hypothetical protein
MLEAFNKYIKKSKICKENTCISSKPIDINQSDTELYTQLKKELSILYNSLIENNGISNSNGFKIIL